MCVCVRKCVHLNLGVRVSVRVRESEQEGLGDGGIRFRSVGGGREREDR